MGRPRAFDPETVIAAARDTFWYRGYELASIEELEERTGLKRSSLYNAFGSKRGLFEAALRHYIAHETKPTLAGMQRPDAGLDDVVEYFTARATALRSHPDRTARGCLMINTIAAFGTRDAAVARAAALHRQCVAEAFATALHQAADRGDLQPDQVARRAHMLVSAAVGISLTARTDPAAAAEACEAIAQDVSTWRSAGGSPRRRAQVRG